MKRRVVTTAFLLLALLAGGCSTPPPSATEAASTDEGLRQRSDSQRLRALEQEVERLRADLAEAEQALVNVESGMLGNFSRAEAVSRVAEARIQLERSHAGHQWQAPALAEAQAKLETAEAQLRDEHYAAAIFFASRSERIARQAQDAARLEQTAGSLRVSGSRVNLREEPSIEALVKTVLVAGTPVVSERRNGDWMLVRTPGGTIGWVHASLVRPVAD